MKFEIQSRPYEAFEVADDAIVIHKSETSIDILRLFCKSILKIEMRMPFTFVSKIMNDLNKKVLSNVNEYCSETLISLS